MASSKEPNNDAGSVKRNRSHQWKLPENARLWQLGRKAKWPVLESFLDSSGADDLYVEDQASERTLTDLQRLFNASSDAAKRGIVHEFVRNLGGDNASLLKRVLALGIEPDLEMDDGSRPSHVCGGWARPESAKAIALCRPSLTAVNSNGDTPHAAAARTNYVNNETRSHDMQEPQLKLRRPAVLKVWEELEKSGFPSLARMASTRQWWAVKNLCRRHLISDQEALEKYDGKTAIQWALAFGEMRLAQELRYFFRKVLPAEQLVDLDDALAAKPVDFEASVSQLRDDVRKVSESTTAAFARIDCEAAKQRDVVTELLSQLRIEIAEIREEMRENVRKVTEKLETVEAETQKSNDPGSSSRRKDSDHEDDFRAPKGCAGLGKSGTENVRGLASYLVKRVDSALAKSQQSPEFVARLAGLLEEYEDPQQ